MKILATLLMIACAGYALAEGTLTESEVTLGNPNKLTLTWTASTNGWSSNAVGKVRGEIKRVTFNPVMATPANSDYTVTIKDESLTDILAGHGSSLSSNTVSTFVPGIEMLAYGSSMTNSLAPFVVNDAFVIETTNHGASVSGEIIIYYQP